jgi:hypothetical protein
MTWMAHCSTHWGLWIDKENRCEDALLSSIICKKQVMVSITQGFDNAIHVEITNEEREAIIEWMKT